MNWDTFTVRITDADRKALERLAAMHDRKPGAFLRHLLRESARQAGVLPVIAGQPPEASTQGAENVSQ